MPGGNPMTADAMKAAMRKAIPSGGAEMGQRSPRVMANKQEESLHVVAGSRAVAGSIPLAISQATDPGHWSPPYGIAGQDVSAYQGNVDWAAQWNQGSRFAYVKASEGNYYVNGNFSQQYDGSRSVGMIRGAYHFAIPNWSSGADQARYFVANGGGWSGDGYTLPPVLDIEYNPYEGQTINGFYFGNTCYGMSAGQMASWISDFGNTVKSLIGRYPVIYSTTDWWATCTGNSGGFANYPLWIASYPSSPSSSPGTLPASWNQFSFWQYSSTGPFSGDSNIWNGDFASLSTFAGNSVPQAASDQISAYRNGHPALGNQTTAITCGLVNGGCFQGFQGGTIMWSPASGAFPITAGPIADAWRSTGLESGRAGYPTSELICGLKNGGCFQNFQGGSFMWSPATGAALVQPGAIRDYWASKGFESGALGYPTSSLTCGLKNGGCFQTFQAGSVLSSPSTPPVLVKSGPMLDAWGGTGFENGVLGYPAAEASCDASSCVQKFQGGVVAWTSTSGAWPIILGIADTWNTARAQSVPIGFPLAKEVCGLRASGCYQLFQGGVIMFSPNTGAFTLTGRLLDYWQKSGFENGSLGYPTSSANCGLTDSGCIQSFEKGSVVYSNSTPVQAVGAGAMLDAWKLSGMETGSLGYPVSAQICGLKDGGCFQMFAKGALMYSPATGAQPSINGPIRDLWQQGGFESGRLGYPASSVLCGLRNSGCFQNYQGGTIMVSGATSANALMMGPIRDAWVKSGFEGGTLGYPTSAQICGLRNGGCFQNFEKGTVMWSQATGAQPMTSDPIRARWGQSGFESGSLGYPTSATICGLRNGGCFENFENGTIMWSPTSGAQAMVPGPIQQAWAGQGFEGGRAGYPTTSQTCSPDGTSCTQSFQGATITWSSASGVKILAP